VSECVCVCVCTMQEMTLEEACVRGVVLAITLGCLAVTLGCLAVTLGCFTRLVWEHRWSNTSTSNPPCWSLCIKHVHSLDDDVPALSLSLTHSHSHTHTHTHTHKLSCSTLPNQIIDWISCTHTHIKPHAGADILSGPPCRADRGLL